MHNKNKPFSCRREAFLFSKKIIPLPFYLYLFHKQKPSMKNTKLKYEFGYPLRYQNLKEAKLASYLLIFLVACTYLSPLLYRSIFLKEKINVETFIIFIFTLVSIFSLYQIWVIYKYLHNFYHPRSNIFINLRWNMVAVAIISLLILAGIIVDSYNNTDLQSGMPMHANITEYGNIQVIITMLLATYVLWAFTQALTGCMLIDSRDVDYVGGMPTLCYALFVSAIIPLFIIAVPICTMNLITKAKKYSEKYGYLNSDS